LYQVLLLLLFGGMFLFTSMKMKVKKLVLWLFASSIVVHASGLSLRGKFAWLDEALIVNGLLMLIVISYMCYLIYTRFGRSKTKRPSKIS
jgi:hypothetical protein